MSSLRLALKQSLEDAGPQLPKKKKKNRRRLDDDLRTGNKKSYSKKKRGPGRPRKGYVYETDSSSNDDEDDARSHSDDDDHDDDSSSNNNSSSSDENEFSDDADDSSDDDDNDTQNTPSVADSAAGTGGTSTSALFKSDSSDDSDDYRAAMMQRKLQKAKKKQKKKQLKHAKNTAANRIQNQWKKKKNSNNNVTASTTSSNARSTQQEQHSHNHQYQQQQSPSHQRPHQPEDHSPHHHHSDNTQASHTYKQQQHEDYPTSEKVDLVGGEKSIAKKPKKDKKKSSTKARTVIPPTGDLVSWMHSLSVETKRKNIAAGHRVKVRFVTKVKREGKVVRKLKWYGGLVTGVSTGGSKIRIKYDDGTSEVAKFPDKDIVVDDEENDFHRVAADVFLPPVEEEDDDDEEEEMEHGDFEKKEVGAVAVAEMASSPTATTLPTTKRYQSPFHDDDMDDDENEEGRKQRNDGLSAKVDPMVISDNSKKDNSSAVQSVPSPTLAIPSVSSKSDNIISTKSLESTSEDIAKEKTPERDNIFDDSSLPGKAEKQLRKDEESMDIQEEPADMEKGELKRDKVIGEAERPEAKKCETEKQAKRPETGEIKEAIAEEPESLEMTKEETLKLHQDICPAGSDMEESTENEFSIEDATKNEKSDVKEGEQTVRELPITEEKMETEEPRSEISNGEVPNIDQGGREETKDEVKRREDSIKETKVDKETNVTVLNDLTKDNVNKVEASIDKNTADQVAEEEDLEIDESVTENVEKDGLDHDQVEKNEVKSTVVKDDESSEDGELQEDELDSNQTLSEEKPNNAQAEKIETIDDESEVNPLSLGATESSSRPTLPSSQSDKIDNMTKPTIGKSDTPPEMTTVIPIDTRSTAAREEDKVKPLQRTHETVKTTSTMVTTHLARFERDSNEEKLVVEEKRPPSKPSLTIRISKPKADRQSLVPMKEKAAIDKTGISSKPKQQQHHQQGAKPLLSGSTVDAEILQSKDESQATDHSTGRDEAPALIENKVVAQGDMPLAGTKRPQEDSFNEPGGPIPKKRHKINDATKESELDIPAPLSTTATNMDVDDNCTTEEKPPKESENSMEQKQLPNNIETKQDISYTEATSKASKQSVIDLQMSSTEQLRTTPDDNQVKPLPQVQEKELRHEEETPTMTIKHTIQRKDSSESVSQNEPPAPISSDFKQSTSDDTELSKPVSKVATTIHLEANEMQEKAKDGPVLTSSKNSAFDRKNGDKSDEKEKPPSAPENGSVQELISDKKTTQTIAPLSEGGEAVSTETAPPQDSAPAQESASTKVTSGIPVARSGRRAAQQANKRIVGGKKERATEDTSAKKKKKDKQEVKEGKRKHDPDGSEDEEDDRQWVQCDNCQKWRVLPRSIKVDSLPKHWYCEMNEYDPAHNTCDAPEQSLKDVAKTRKRKKKRGPRAKSPSEPREVPEDQDDSVFANDSKDAKGEKAKERSLSRSPLTIKKESLAQRIASPKGKRTSPTNVNVSPDSPGSDNGGVYSRTEPSKKAYGKKSKHDKTNEGIMEESEVVSNKGKGGKRGRRERGDAPGGKDSEKERGKGGKGSSKGEKELEQHQEWVMCEKCEKWRKLPKHISAADLPDVWYCSMNTWDSNTASCRAKEDKVDPNTREFNMFGSTGNSGGSSGKLSYRNLIFGTGRKQNRPISERTRAAESIFNPIKDDDADGSLYPTAAMYATSSAFVCKGSNASKFGLDNGEGRISFFDLMNQSHLWAELRGGFRRYPSNSPIPTKPENSNLSYDELPENVKSTLREIIYHALGTNTLAGHEVLLEAQCRQWENVPPEWAQVRALCTIELVMAILFESVKNGDVQMLKGIKGDDSTVGIEVARYRRVIKSSPEPKRSRCMKIAKPWKMMTT